MAEDTPPATLSLPPTMTVKELADELNLKVSQVMTELIKRGVMATINDRIDYDSAAAVAEVFGLAVAPQAQASSAVDQVKSTVSEGDLRPPVIAVMGHVDHGKTSLLDAIRKTDVAAREAGGITQHLSAYQIRYKNRPITFIDTPGHEAFSILREHGAYLTDVAIIVVAADDGVKPQTIEAIKFALKAGVKMVVAITKIDKPGVDLNRVKQGLSDQGLQPEEWGGDTVTVEVSSKTGEGVDKLLDLVLLVVDIEDLRAPATGPAEGTVIEAHMATGKGPLATLLVSQGKLTTGNFIVAGQIYGKVRTLEGTDGATVAEAGPSYPAVVSGWKSLPQSGDHFEVVSDEKAAKLAANQSATSTTQSHFASSNPNLEGEMAKELKILVKADVHGSLESVLQSVGQLGNKEVGVKVVAQGVGPISESDVNLAASAQAIIIGFNVAIPVRIKQLAEQSKVKVRLFKIIYELIDDVKADLEALLEPEVVEQILGKLEVKGVFRTTASSVICGGLVKDGKISAGLLVRIANSEDLTEIGKVDSVQKEQRAVPNVVEGEMCGLNLSTKHKTNLKIGDELEFFSRETKERTL